MVFAHHYPGQIAVLCLDGSYKSEKGMIHTTTDLLHGNNRLQFVPKWSVLKRPVRNNDFAVRLLDFRTGAACPARGRGKAAGPDCIPAFHVVGPRKAATSCRWSAGNRHRFWPERNTTNGSCRCSIRGLFPGWSHSSESSVTAVV